MILGIRTSTKAVRFAILEQQGSTISLINANSENMLTFPASYQKIEQKLNWLFNELERILRQHPDINKIVIKTNEYAPGREQAKSREAAYYDSVILLIAERKQLPVSLKVYKSIGTKRAEVKNFSSTKVGSTSNHWDEPMADAVAAAWTLCGE